jgi:FMN phosphatase YigB (HAD superfamily)
MEIRESFPSNANELSTLLYDLDGTLVRMRRRSLEWRFMLRAIRRFALGIPPWRFKKAFWASADRMQNHQTDALNYDVLVDELSSYSRWSRERMARELRLLLVEDFPYVADRIEGIPGARETLELSRELGFGVVLATNPVWPLLGVEMRLEWGGLGDFAFDYVTHSEIMTRCKPDPAYYAQLLDHLQVPAKSCLMIGNDAMKDLPAREVGIATFLVTHDGKPLARDVRNDPRLDAWGNFEEFRGWLAGGKENP